MTDIMQDKYILGQSQNKSIENVGEEIRLDLDLNLNNRDINGTVVDGTVTDTDGNPIEGAIVKLMSIDYNPLMHSITNVDGYYSIQDIPPNESYRIYAIAKGKKLKKGTVFISKPYLKIKMHFILESDPSMELGIIAGDVKDINTNQNLNGAVISLYKEDPNQGEILKSVVYTNEFGQFVFRQVEIGDYIIRSNSLGYNVNNISISIGASGQIASAAVFLTPNPNKSKGTVSGLIKDTNGNPIDNADVILYNVNQDSSLTPIAFTKTDVTGVYLFNNVPQGTYKIKSTETKFVEVNLPISPNFKSFTIATLGVLIPLEFTAVEGALFNGARLVVNNNFVGYLGGANNGYVVANANVSYEGEYTLSIQYLAGDNNRPLKLKVNDVDIGVVLDCPQTNGWTENDAKWINTTINLDQGINFIEFYNDSGNDAPSIGKYNLTFKPQSVTKNATEGILENGAKSIFNNTFVDLIGGDQNGSFTLTLNAPISAQYILYIQYLSNDTTRPLKINLNGTFLGNYIVPPSGSWEPNEAKYYTIELDLNAGNNTFKFYNDTGEYSPVIGNITLSQPNVNTTYNAEDTLLFNGAKVENGLVTGIGQNAGYLMFSTNIPIKGFYDFIIKYASTDNTTCNIEVNEISTEETYIFPPTQSNTDPTGVLNTSLYLAGGNNTIKVYNE